MVSSVLPVGTTLCLEPTEWRLTNTPTCALATKCSVTFRLLLNDLAKTGQLPPTRLQGGSVPTLLVNGLLPSMIVGNG
jgi:hypothetical protein